MPRKGHFYVEPHLRLDYSSRMRHPIFLSLLFLASASAMAGVYKSVGPDGHVQYTDRPISGAEMVPVPQSRPTDVTDPGPSPAAGSEDTGPYDTFEIAFPEPDSTVRSENDELQVGMILTPPLLSEHQFQLLIDNRPIEGNVPGTQMTLSDVGLGTHSLQAQVLDEFGVPVAYTASVTFHMRKPVPE